MTTPDPTGALVAGRRAGDGIDPLRLVGSDLPADVLADAVCVAITERAPGVGAAILRVDAPTRTLHVLASRRLPNLVIDDLPLGRAGGAIGRAVSLDETIVDASPWADQSDPDALVAAAPIPHDGAPVGAVVVIGDASLVDDSTILHLEACSQLLGLIVDRTDDSLLTVSATTGLRDRSAAATVLARASTRTGGLGGTFLTVLVDLGDHPAAELRDAATLLTSAIRGNDHLFDVGDGLLLVVCGHLGTARDADPLVDRVATALREAETSAAVGAVVQRTPVDGGRALDRALAVHPQPLEDGPPLITDLTAVDGEAPVTLDEIEAALQSGAVGPWYQPIVSIETGRAVGVEALARWRHPDGLRSPDTFVPALEAAGRVERLTDIILRAAASDLAHWRSRDLVDDGFTVSVNVSAGELGDESFAERAKSVIQAVGVEPSAVRIELTETLALADRVVAIRVLEELRRCGFTIALDDFGTGYATFASLRSLPIDVVKIDRSFVESLPDRSSETVVHSVVDLASVLDLVVVAEGVEDQDHLAFLRTAGVHHVQGYLLSEPVEPAAVPTMLAGLSDGPVDRCA